MRDDVGDTEDRLARPVEADDRTRLAIDTIGLSHALQAVVSRRYLDLPLGEVMQPLPEEGARRTEAAAFLRLTQIGKPLAGSTGDALTALQNVLTACHAPGRFTLVFLLASDGTQNSVYLGAQSHDNRSSAKGFLRTIANFLEANWPGTQLTPAEASDETFQCMVEKPLRSEASAYAVALTGVPSLKSGEARGYPQTLDRLLNGMRGKPFLYMVIAEPIAVSEVDDILNRCRDLISQIHVFAKSALTLSSSVQETQTEGTSVGKSFGHSIAESTGWSRSQAESGYFKEELKNFFLWGKPSAQLAETNTTTTTETSTDTSTVSQSFAQTTQTGRNIGQEHINTHALAVETHLQQYVKRFEQSLALGCWNVGAYVLAEREDLVRQGGMQIKALLTGQNSLYEPIRLHDIYRFWGDARAPLAAFRQPNLGVVRSDAREPKTLTAANRVEHLLGRHFSGLTTPLNTEELALLTNLPQREIAGIPLVATASFSLNVAAPGKNDIVLGSLIDGGRPTTSPYPVSFRTLVKHTLVTGITGSGKSTTCFRMLGELQRNRVPFLVIEPAKDEYVDWAMRQNESIELGSSERIRVYMPGARSWRDWPLTDQLVINPLDIVWLGEDHSPAVLSHVDRLKSILNATFPMQEALPILLEDVLFSVYSTPCNWLNDALPPFGSPRPTLRHMHDAVRTVVHQKGYEDRVAANLAATLTTRLQSLRRGWKGKVFDQPQSTPWSDIFDKPTVINLSQLGDDADKAFAMAMILQFLYEYRQAQFDVDASLRVRPTTLRHLTVVEEAHRVLQRAVAVSAGEASPQGKVAQMFSDVLSEIRAYGEGLLIVDQVPARLVPDAIKNTNLKIVHRVVADDDRAAMSGCMTLTPEQGALINRLRVGQVIAYSDQDDMAAWVKVTL